VKGGGGAHTREKVVAAASERFVVIVSADKLVDALRAPVPLELLEFGLAGTLRRLGPCRLRAGSRSPDGGLIADWLGEVRDPGVLASRLDADPGVVSHGLFPPEMVTDLVIGGANGARLVQRESDEPRPCGP
jgi:ribose 5-phosphate isomerase A